MSSLLPLLSLSAVEQSSGQVFLGRRPCDTELLTDLLDGEALEAVENERGRNHGGQLVQYGLQCFHSLLDLALALRIVRGGDLQFCERLVDIDHRRGRVLAKRVLVDDVTRDGEQVGFGAADGVVAVDPQEPEKNLLRQVRGVRRVAQTKRQEAPEASSVLRCNCCGESILVGICQGILPGAGPLPALEPNSSKSGYGIPPRERQIMVN